jgi:hypothetical protein
MNTIEATEAAAKITSITLSEYLAAGGKITKLETINTGDRPDDAVNVFECEDRDGTFTSDNACVSWIDASFERVVEALRAGDVSDLPDSQAISKI